MTAKILDGKAVAAKERTKSAARAADFISKFGRAPGLAVVKVGEDPASAVYVRNKRKACEECGIASFAHDLPASTTREELLALIKTLNDDDRVDGILLQLPLPKGLDSTEIMDTIDPAKDVDGFHPTNTGLVSPEASGPAPVHALGRDPAGEGIPARPHRPACRAWSAPRTSSAVRWRWNCCSRVPRSPCVTRARATCAAKWNARSSWSRPWARRRTSRVSGFAKARSSFDVGINRGADGKLCGDVEFAAAAERAAWITPVPGGVGPMTIAMLLSNTVDAALARAVPGKGSGVSREIPTCAAACAANPGNPSPAPPGVDSGHEKPGSSGRSTSTRCAMPATCIARMPSRSKSRWKSGSSSTDRRRTAAPDVRSPSPCARRATTPSWRWVSCTAKASLREPRDVVDVRPCGPTGNVVRVTVRADLPLDLDRLNRNFYTTSSCGVCGKASIEAVTASAGIRRVSSRPGS